jgi:hypothetical protein
MKTSGLEDLVLLFLLYWLVLPGSAPLWKKGGELRNPPRKRTGEGFALHTWTQTSTCLASCSAQDTGAGKSAQRALPGWYHYVLL